MKNLLKIFFLGGLLFLQSSQTIFAESLKISLNDAINFALKNNRTIEQSEDDREAARWNLSAVRRSFGPTLRWVSRADKIGGRYYDIRREGRINFENASDEERSYSPYRLADFPKYESETYNSIDFSIPIYSGGKLEAQKKSAEFSLNSADLNLENTRQEIKFRTTQAFYQVLQYKDLMNVRQEEMKNLSEHLETVKIQYAVGTVAMSDFLATNVQLANSRQNYNSAQINFENSVATLNNLIGLPVETTLIIDDDLQYLSFDEDENFCLEYALSHRPDGIAANFSVKSSEENVNQAKSGTRPNISAVISGNFSGEGAFKADHDAERWMAGIEMNWNLFDNNVTSAQVNQAKMLQKKAESQAQEQIEKIRLEVHNAYTALRISEKNVKISEETITQAQEQFLIAKVRYEEGVDTNLNVMDAQEKLTQARTNYFSALYSYNTSKAELEKAMGIPIKIDAEIYKRAVDEGKVSKKALEISKVE